MQSAQKIYSDQVILHHFEALKLEPRKAVSNAHAKVEIVVGEEAIEVTYGKRRLLHFALGHQRNDWKL